MNRQSYVHEGLLGTTAHIQVESVVAEDVEAAVVAEIRRLDDVFSTYKANSQLCRWRAGDDSAAGPELIAVLEQAQRWHQFSAGAFHPCTENIRRWWLEAQQRGAIVGRPPVAGELPFRVVAGTVERLGDCSGLDLNAIAKGYITDSALNRGWQCGATWLSVNIGGDLHHRGEQPIRVGVENPLSRFDNAKPIRVLELHNQAMATSGSARRGFRIAGQWYPHVLDPRTGWPVDRVASVTVIADDAMTADAAATAIGVGGVIPDGVQYLLIDQVGQITTNLTDAG